MFVEWRSLRGKWLVEDDREDSLRASLKTFVHAVSAHTVHSKAGKEALIRSKTIHLDQDLQYSVSGMRAKHDRMSHSLIHECVYAMRVYIGYDP